MGFESNMVSLGKIGEIMADNTTSMDYKLVALMHEAVRIVDRPSKKSSHRAPDLFSQTDPYDQCLNSFSQLLEKEKRENERLEKEGNSHKKWDPLHSVIYKNNPPTSPLHTAETIRKTHSKNRQLTIFAKMLDENFTDRIRRFEEEEASQFPKKPLGTYKRVKFKSNLSREELARQEQERNRQAWLGQ